MFSRDEQNLWNFLFALFYAAVLAGGSWALWSFGRLPVGITFFDASLIALASFRLTRLFVYDRGMQFFRDWFLDVFPSPDAGGPVRALPARGPRRTASELLSCPWCFGLWGTMLTAFGYYASPYLWLPILIVALAGVASLLQLCANWLGWHANIAKDRAGGVHEH